MDFYVFFHFKDFLDTLSLSLSNAFEAYYIHS